MLFETCMSPKDTSSLNVNSQCNNLKLPHIQTAKQPSKKENTKSWTKKDKMLCRSNFIGKYYHQAILKNTHKSRLLKT